MPHSASEVRERVERAASEIFFGVGYSNITMDQLAERAQVSKRTIYKYFRSKEELASIVLARLRAHQGATFATLVEESNGDIVRLFFLLLQRTHASMSRVPHGLYADLKENAPNVYAEHAGLRHIQVRNTFNETVRLGIEAGVITHNHPSLLVELITSSWEHMVDPQTRLKVGARPADMFAEAFIILVRGIFTPMACESFDSMLEDSKFLASLN